MTKSSSSPPKRKNNYTIPQLKIERLCSGEYSLFHYYIRTVRWWDITPLSPVYFGSVTLK